ncbi:MAG: HAD family hydrolase [Pseudomonadota bacterium]
MLPDHIEAVLFDFDGTLAPNLDLPSMRREVIALTNRYAVPAPVYEGEYIVEIIRVSTDYLRCQDEAVAQAYFAEAHDLIRDIEIRASRATRQFDGVDQLLASLRARGLRTGVVTRNCREAVLQVYPALLQDTDILIARDDTQHIKPDPRHLLAALGALDSAPASAAMVGDGVLDMKVGKLAGMYCIGVLSGSSDRRALLGAGADTVINTCLLLHR